MKKAVLVLLLFLAQNYLITQGSLLFSTLLMPFLITFLSIVLVVVYFKTILSAGKSSPGEKLTTGNKLTGFIAGIGCITVLLQQAITTFNMVPDPSTGSDVVPQLVALYQRSLQGIQPYFPLEQYSWHPFPVYMPLHWLPLGLGYLFHIDIRWIGFIFMALSCGILGFTIWEQPGGIKKIISIALPAIALCCFLLWARYELAVSYEIIIAAYYLLLCAGLVSGNLVLITAGVIACILSRYTVIFWVPLLFIVLWQNVTAKKSILVWSSVLVALLLLYIIPFYLRDPSILSQGVAYHNKCYIDIWKRIDDPLNTTAFNGLNFSYYVYSTVSGDAAHRIAVERIIQAVLMLSLLAGGTLLYRKWKTKVKYNHFALGMLYCFIQVFFLFSPFNFLYYYLPVQVIAAVLCVQIILGKQTRIAIDLPTKN